MAYGHAKSKHSCLIDRTKHTQPILVSKKLKELLKEYDPFGLKEMIGE